MSCECGSERVLGVFHGQGRETRPSAFLCPVRPEGRLASSSSVVVGTRSGAEEQEYRHRRSVPEPPDEMESARERVKKRRTQRNLNETRVNQPLLSEQCMKQPVFFSVHCPASVSPAGATDVVPRFEKKRMEE